jgi:hypothetical protein
MRHTPLCGGIGAKKDKAQGRGFEPRPMEVGHLAGPGEPVVQPATVSIPHEEGEKGVVVGICVFGLLPDRPTLEPALTQEQEEG